MDACFGNACDFADDPVCDQPDAGVPTDAGMGADMGVNDLGGGEKDAAPRTGIGRAVSSVLGFESVAIGGVVVDGACTVAELGEDIFREILDVASGKRTRSEELGLGDNEFVPWSLGIVT